MLISLILCKSILGRETICQSVASMKMLSKVLINAVLVDNHHCTCTLYAYLNKPLLAVSFLQAFAVCCCLFMVYKALKWSTSNIDSLLKQQQQVSSYIIRLGLSYISDCTVDDLQMAKINLYRNFRSFMIMWAVVGVIGIAAVVFLTEETWIRALALEIPELVIISGVLVLFRLRSFARYRGIKLKARESDYTVLYGPAGGRSRWPTVYLGEEISKDGSRSSDEESVGCQVETVV